jgi:Fe-S-cluster-containing dehydrogenase component
MVAKAFDMAPMRPDEPGAGATILQTQLQKQDKRDTGITFLSTMDFDLATGGSVRLGPGEIFGEIGAMSGWPQSVTARTASECDLVQIRAPALRLMKRRSSALKQRLDKIYRERALAAQLKTTPLLQQCDDAFIRSLAQKVELVSCEPDEIITPEGEPVDALYLIRSGFVKLKQKFGEGEIVVSYLSKGMTLGEVELLVEGLKGWAYNATSVEYTELVKISREDFHATIQKFPGIERQLWEIAVFRIKEVGANKRDVSQGEFIQAALEKGLVQGNSILVIDMEVCTRCDDCVRACADTHGGRPRFVREGDKYENFLITKACYHCRDPVCLVGCPTGAIRRAAVGDVVEIVDSLCIGCKACANNCPYDAIVMHETGEVWPDDAIPEANRGRPRLLASKCDLCYKTNHGPACVNNCPHGCAFRIGSVEEFQHLVKTAHS